MTLPTVTATGNLTRDVETRITQGGHAVSNLSIACNDRRKNPQTGEWEDGDTTFLDVTAWRQLGEAAADLNKGEKVMITGRLRQRSYETRDGQKRTAMEVEADVIARVLKTPGQGQARTQQPRQQAQADPWGPPAQPQGQSDPWAQSGTPEPSF